MSASISRSEPKSRRGHGPRCIVSSSVLRVRFAIFSGRGCPTPDHKSKSNRQDSRRISRTTIPVHFSSWAVVHRLLRTVQRVLQHPSNLTPRFARRSVGADRGERGGRITTLPPGICVSVVVV